MNKKLGGEIERGLNSLADGCEDDKISTSWNEESVRGAQSLYEGGNRAHTPRARELSALEGRNMFEARNTFEGRPDWDPLPLSTSRPSSGFPVHLGLRTFLGPELHALDYRTSMSREGVERFLETQSGLEELAMEDAFGSLHVLPTRRRPSRAGSVGSETESLRSFQSQPSSMIHKSHTPLTWHRPLPSTSRPLPSSSSHHHSSESLPEALAEDNTLVTLSLSTNATTAHLANLMTSHLTISPSSQGLSHLLFRGAPVEGGSVSGARRVRRGTRRLHVVKVPGGMIREVGSSAGSTFSA